MRKIEHEKFRKPKVEEAEAKNQEKQPKWLGQLAERAKKSWEDLSKRVKKTRLKMAAAVIIATAEGMTGIGCGELQRIKNQVTSLEDIFKQDPDRVVPEDRIAKYLEKNDIASGDVQDYENVLNSSNIMEEEKMQWKEAFKSYFEIAKEINFETEGDYPVEFSIIEDQMAFDFLYQSVTNKQAPGWSAVTFYVYKTSKKDKIKKSHIIFCAESIPLPVNMIAHEMVHAKKGARNEAASQLGQIIWGIYDYARNDRLEQKFAMSGDIDQIISPFVNLDESNVNIYKENLLALIYKKIQDNPEKESFDLNDLLSSSTVMFRDDLIMKETHDKKFYEVYYRVMMRSVYEFVKNKIGGSEKFAFPSNTEFNPNAIKGQYKGEFNLFVFDEIRYLGAILVGFERYNVGGKMNTSYPIPDKALVVQKNSLDIENFWEAPWLPWYEQGPKN